MSISTQDDAFREIQLSGKQLVFLFMAVTVLAVVIFLSGVMVGRGVREARALPTGGDPAVVVANAPKEPDAPPAAVAPAPATSGTSTGLVTSGEKLTYATRLNGAEPSAAEQLQKAEPPAPAEENPKASTAAPPTPAPARAAAPARPAQQPAADPGASAGAVFSIQVAALREAGEADAVVKRLSDKGYPAYVVAPGKGEPPVYRVRVGRYKDRREADLVAARLQQEEQFKPWVVR